MKITHKESKEFEPGSFWTDGNHVWQIIKDGAIILHNEDFEYPRLSVNKITDLKEDPRLTPFKGTIEYDNVIIKVT
jgi:hypothetical protein